MSENNINLGKIIIKAINDLVNDCLKNVIFYLILALIIILIPIKDKLKNWTLEIINSITDKNKLIALYQNTTFWVVLILLSILFCTLSIAITNFILQKKLKKTFSLVCNEIDIPNPKSWIDFLNVSKQIFLDHNNYEDYNFRFWNNFICNTKQIISQPTEDKSLIDSLSIFLGFAVEKLNNSDYKISVVQPQDDGHYKLLVCTHNIDSDGRTSITEKNWLDDNDDDLYRKAFHFTKDKPFNKFPADDKVKKNMKRKGLASSAHFIIRLIDDNCPNKCLAIIGIGIPKEEDFIANEENNEAFYKRVFPAIKGKEAFMLIHKSLN